MECPIYTRLKRRSPHAPRELEREHLAERGGASLLVWPLNTHRKLVTTAGAISPMRSRAEVDAPRHVTVTELSHG